MSVGELARYVNEVARTREMGGRCTAVDDTRCILYDCGNWSTAMHDAVAARFHTCCVNVTPFESSVSGFIVIFELSAPPRRLRTACVLAGALLGLLVVTGHVVYLLAPDVELWPPFLNASARVY